MANESLAQKSMGRLIVAGISGLVVVSLLCVLGTIALARVVRSQSNLNELDHLTRRQRFISQEVRANALHDDSARPSKLASLLKEWKSNAQAQEVGYARLAGAGGPNLGPRLATAEEDRLAIAKIVSGYVADPSQFSRDPALHDALARDIEVHQAKYVASITDMVTVLDTERTSMLTLYQRLDALILAAVLVTLGLIGFFLFRSIMVRSRKLVSEIEETSSSAEDRNEELARANHQLVVAANRFESLFQRLPVACLGYDTEGVVREWNADAERMFGFAAYEVFDQPIWSIIRYADDSVDGQDAFECVFRTGQAVQGVEVTLLHRDGRLVHAVCSIVPIHGPSGEVSSAITSYVDVTEIVLAKAEAARERDFNNAILGTAGCLVCVADKEGRFVRFNAECERVTGWKASEVAGSPFWDIVILESEREVVLEAFRSWVAGAFPSTIEHHWVTKMGENRLINFTTTALVDTDGNVEFVIGTGIDVTERRALEAKLAETNGIRGAILESARYGIIATDVEGRILTFNRAAEEMLGFAAGEVLGSETPMLVHDSAEVDQRALELGVEPGFAVLAAYAQGLPTEVEWTYIAKDGKTFPVLLSVTALRAEDGRITGYLSVAQDISERKAAELQISEQMKTISSYAGQLETQKKQLESVNKRLERLASTDGLTGLKNHRTFKELLINHYQLSRRSNLPLSVVLLDVDRFKQFNDTYGHQAGDDVLRSVGRILSETARTTDIVARYGGEEFVLILPGSDKGAALEAAERFRKALEQATWTYREVTASFGISTIQPATESPEQLVKLADGALYRSKANGRNCVTHDLDRDPTMEATEES